jgi:hypothetical protein
MVDMTWRDRTIMLPLLVAILFLGVYPKPVLDRIQPSVDHLIAHVQHVDPGLHVPASGLDPATAGAVGASEDVDGPLPSGSASASGSSGSASGSGGP